MNRRARLLVQLEVSGDEVGVKVREDDVTDRQSAFSGERYVLIDVTLRIDDGRCRRRLVADQIRRVREAVEIELVKNHDGVRLHHIFAHVKGCEGSDPV